MSRGHRSLVTPDTYSYRKQRQAIMAIKTAASLLIGAAAAQNLTFGADNFYRSDNVTVRQITFSTVFRTTVAANLYFPNDLDLSLNASAVVVGHPMGAVKEQSGNLHAQKLAEQGFVTISLDLPF